MGIQVRVSPFSGAVDSITLTQGFVKEKSPRINMGTEDKRVDSEYGAAKTRINTALATLRQELEQIRAQDVALLRQLMQIHCAINALNGRRDAFRRSYSTNTALHDSLPDLNVHESLRQTNSNPPLTRCPSEPLHDGSEDENEADGSIDGDHDLLAWSFSSFADLPEWPRSLEKSFSESLPSPHLGSNRKRCSIIEEEIGDNSNNTTLCDPYANIHQWLTHSQKELNNNEINVSQYNFETCEEDRQMVNKTDKKCMLRRQDAINVSYDEESDAKSMSKSMTDLTILTKDTKESDKSIKKLRRKSGLEKYEVSYEDMLKRSSQLWREIQTEKKETGTVDARKMATFKMFL